MCTNIRCGCPHLCRTPAFAWRTIRFIQEVAVKLQERALVESQGYEANVRREIAILESVRVRVQLIGHL